MNSITIHQLGCLLLRVLALLLTLQVLPSLVSALGMVIFAGQGLVPVLQMAFPLMLMLFLNVLLWVMAPWLAGKMVTQSASIQAPFSIENLQIVFFVLLGFMFLAESIRPLTTATFHVASVLTEGKSFHGTTIVEAILYLSLALWLILGSKGITRLIKYMRTTGGEK